MKKEIYKDIADYEGLYQVSDLGNVKSLSRVIVRGNGRKQTFKERILKMPLSSHGYRNVNLSKNGVIRLKTVHTLVAVAFLNHEPNGYEIVVDHIDNNPLNNRLDNLQLITQRENVSKNKEGGTSKYVGVSWSKSRNKWVAMIQIGNKNKNIGGFTNELEASEAYQKELEIIYDHNKRRQYGTNVKV